MYKKISRRSKKLLTLLSFQEEMADYIRGHGFSPEDAERIFCEVMIAVYTKLDSLNDVENMKKWVYGISDMAMQYEIRTGGMVKKERYCKKPYSVVL